MDKMVQLKGPRTPARTRALVEKAVDAGLGANAIRVVPGGYLVPASLVPHKRSRKVSADSDEGEN